jgi:hypothetical protein
MVIEGLPFGSVPVMDLVKEAIKSTDPKTASMKSSMDTTQIDNNGDDKVSYSSSSYLSFVNFRSFLTTRISSNNNISKNTTSKTVDDEINKNDIEKYCEEMHAIIFSNNYVIDKKEELIMYMQELGVMYAADFEYLDDEAVNRIVMHLKPIQQKQFMKSFKKINSRKSTIAGGDFYGATNAAI